MERGSPAPCVCAAGRCAHIRLIIGSPQERANDVAGPQHQGANMRIPVRKMLSYPQVEDKTDFHLKPPISLTDRDYRCRPGEQASRRHRRQFESEHRNVKGSNAEVSIGDTACSILRGPGTSIDIVSRLPQRARRAIGLLAYIGDSHCGSVAFPGHA